MPGAPQHLRCDFVENPLGVSGHQPQLSWWPVDRRPAEIQSAYELLVASAADLLKQDKADIWHSGVVEGTSQSSALYSGTALAEGQGVWWKVRTYDSDGLPSPWSDTAYFEMGIGAEAFTGQWICAQLMGSRTQSVQVPILRREFIANAAVRQARLYVAALGDYRPIINNKPLQPPIMLS